MGGLCVLGMHGFLEENIRKGHTFIGGFFYGCRNLGRVKYLHLLGFLLDVRDRTR